MDQFPDQGGDVSRRSRLAAVIGGRSSRGNYGLLVDSKGDSKRRFNESFSKRSVGDARAFDRCFSGERNIIPFVATGAIMA